MCSITHSLIWPALSFYPSRSMHACKHARRSFLVLHLLLPRMDMHGGHGIEQARENRRGSSKVLLILRIIIIIIRNNNNNNNRYCLGMQACDRPTDPSITCTQSPLHTSVYVSAYEREGITATTNALK